MTFAEYPMWINAAVFAAAALVVWIAGTKLASYADAIAEVTGLGRAFLGILLLGGVTSLPELAVATTATLKGAPALSINDVLGSAAVNVLVLAVADAVSGRRALTAIQASPVLLLQGVLCILMMAFAAAPVITGDVLIWGVGGWSWVMLATYLISIRILAHSNAGHAWKLRDEKSKKKSAPTDQKKLPPLRTLILKTVGVGAAILVAGYLLASTGEALAEQTGLGTSFFGGVFLAFATSLPEWSTVIGATRIRQYELAISDIFGTNLFNVCIVVLVDALHPGGPVMVEAGAFAAFGALLALVLSAFVLVGMVERRDRTVLRMGWDSIAVVVAYVAGVVVLHGLR